MAIGCGQRKAGMIHGLHSLETVIAARELRCEHGHHVSEVSLIRAKSIRLVSLSRLWAMLNYLPTSTILSAPTLRVINRTDGDIRYK